MSDVQKNLWWGYLHENRVTIQAKRYFDDRDLAEARQSDFVHIVVGPFPAENREEALKIVKEQTS